MKKLFLLLASLIQISVSAAAVQEEIKTVIHNLYRNAAAMDGKAMIAQVTENYVEIDEFGEKIDYKAFCAIANDLIKMKETIAKGSSPQADLTAIALAVAALNEESADPEILQLTREIGNTQQGKILADNMRSTLAAMHKIYTDAISEEFKSLEIISITAGDSTAAAVYQVSREDQLIRVSMELVKRSGKWLIVKSTAAAVK